MSFYIRNQELENILDSVTEKDYQAYEDESTWEEDEVKRILRGECSGVRRA